MLVTATKRRADAISSRALPSRATKSPMLITPDLLPSAGTAQCDPFVVRCADEHAPTRLLSEWTFRRQPLVRCYLSAFDALIDTVALCASGDSLYQAVSVSDIPEDAPIDGDTQRSIVVHLGWRARNYRVLQRPDGRLVGLGWVQPPCPAGPSIEIDRRIFFTMSQLFESAGLFAWREVNQLLARRSKLRWATNALQAINSSHSDRDTDVNAYDQIAMFDPEACEWHFVPRYRLPGAPF